MPFTLFQPAFWKCFDAASNASASALPLPITAVLLVAIPPTKLKAPQHFQTPISALLGFLSHPAYPRTLFLHLTISYPPIPLSPSRPSLNFVYTYNVYLLPKFIHHSLLPNFLVPYLPCLHCLNSREPVCVFLFFPYPSMRFAALFFCSSFCLWAFSFCPNCPSLCSSAPSLCPYA